MHADEVYADALIAPHAAYTVTVPKDVQQRGETLRYLRAIPAARVLELQAAVARARHRARGRGDPSRLLFFRSVKFTKSDKYLYASQSHTLSG
jgi:hypothetical protein